MKELTKIQQVTQAIMFGEFTNTELTAIGDAIQFARAQMAKQAARTFWTGDRVKFYDRKRGITHTGNVVKIKLKYALVRTPTTQFNVPLSMLESAE